VLLSAIFRSRRERIPAKYMQEARRLTSAVLSLSDAICTRAGLRPTTTVANSFSSASATVGSMSSASSDEFDVHPAAD
jgi:hypothetical protein